MSLSLVKTNGSDSCLAGRPAGGLGGEKAKKTRAKPLLCTVVVSFALVSPIR